MDNEYDVVVVGGGAAGLSGAIALARSRRSVLVVDEGRPRNARSAHAHNYLGREGVPPAELLASGRADLKAYGGQLISGRVDAIAKRDNGFDVRLEDGSHRHARRLLIATGVVDELPEGVAGLAERWGRDVLHCPYCHGFEYRDRRVGVLATGPMALHQAHLWRQLSQDVVLLLHESEALDAAEAERLAARGITVVEGRVDAVQTEDDRLSGVRLATGEVVELDAVVVTPHFVAGFSLDEPGIWMAGNVTDPKAHLMVSAAAGLNAAAAINADLVAEDTALAVDDYRDRVRTMFSKDGWEERYRAKPAVWSGRPNPQLIAEAAELAPGRALDVGCGEGADAIWLARRGWRVTAVDISAVALRRAEAAAAEAGVADRIEFVETDLRERPPAAGSYDLVTAQFMHLPPEARQQLFARLADAVAVGGALLIVGHHPSDLRTSAHRMHFPDMMYTAEEVAASLDPARWRIDIAETRERTTVNAEGHTHTIHDAVMLARIR